MSCFTKVEFEKLENRLKMETTFNFTVSAQILAPSISFLSIFES